MKELVRSAFLILVLAGGATGAAAMPGMGGSPAEWAAFGEPGHVANRTIAVSATDMRFLPATVQIKRGQTVRFVVTNRGHTAHEFVIGDAAFQAQHQRMMAQMPDMKMDDPNEIEIQPGQTRSLTWRFTRAGDFSYACDLPGHAEAGMVGHISVR